jgi:hypothetical protein
MADALTNITNFITSPPGQLVAGGALAGVVWRFFEKVENVLADDTKLEIAVWLLGVKAGQKVEPLPETFAKVFDRVFGKKHLSWKCFWRSFVLSMIVYFLVLVALVPPVPAGHSKILLWTPLVLAGVIENAIPDYISLLGTRLVLRVAQHTNNVFMLILLLCLDCCITVLIALVAVALAYVSEANLNIILTSTEPHVIWSLLRDPDTLKLYGLAFGLTFNGFIFSHPIAYFHYFKLFGIWFFPAFLTSVWLWLYACSGFLLKFARRFDIGFDWFSRKCDIEHKPLNAIGLVAGCIVAGIWWTVVLVKWIV